MSQCKTLALGGAASLDDLADAMCALRETSWPPAGPRTPPVLFQLSLSRHPHVETIPKLTPQRCFTV